MKPPIHHPPAEYLLGYATGGLGEGESLFVASHASLCRVCRGRVRELEGAAGALLEQQPRAAVSDDLLARTMAQLGAEPRGSKGVERFEGASSDPVLPRPLLRYTGPYADIRWKRSAIGAWHTVLPVSVNGIPVVLRRFSGGVKIPQHTHEGAELEMILMGGASDDRDGRKFERGDVVFNDESDTHSVTVEAGEGCVALSVHAGNVTPIGWWSRLAFALARKY